MFGINQLQQKPLRRSGFGLSAELAHALTRAGSACVISIHMGEDRAKPLKGSPTKRPGGEAHGGF
jgi:hypothetical protein